MRGAPLDHQRFQTREVRAVPLQVQNPGLQLRAGLHLPHASEHQEPKLSLSLSQRIHAESLLDSCS